VVALWVVALWVVALWAVALWAVALWAAAASAVPLRFLQTLCRLSRFSLFQPCYRSVSLTRALNQFMNTDVMIEKVR